MIVHKPDVLLIDEAFDGIEDNTKLEMLDELFNWPSWTIINVSHDPEVVRRTDRAIVLRDGKVVQDGRTDVMCQNQGHPFRTLFPDPEPFLRNRPNPEDGGSRG
jgi:ATP-binding cassette subfamily B protein